MERDQASREQLANRRPAADSWIPAEASPQPQLDDSFHPETFVNVGMLLSSQEMGQDMGQETEQEMPLTAESSFQPPADASPSVSISTLDSPDSVPLAPVAHRAGSPLSQRVVLGLLAVVVALLGTNAYYFNQAHAWKAESSELQARVAKLEKDSATPKIDVDPLATPPSCPGSQLIDTCWFKVGWGDCTKEVIEDPIKPVEDAFRLAWDSTTEVVGFVVDTIASDFREVGKAIHELGSFLFEL